MSRLRYSRFGYLRALQISRSNLFVFVEGRDDIFFYERVCSPVCTAAKAAYQIRCARELPDGTGGKPGLLNWFEYMEGRGKLFDDLGGKKTAAVFFLDKDVDDVTRTWKRSQHTVYTEHYDVEGYLFREGDLLKAAAAAGRTDEASLAGLLRSADRWRRGAATRWKSWVKLCLFTQIARINCACNYGVNSRVNVPIDNRADATLYRARLTELKRRSGLPGKKFRKRFASVSALVDRDYAAGRQERVFKGKWYAHILAADIRRRITGRSIRTGRFAEQLSSHLVLTVDFNGAWTNHFRQPLRNLIARL